MSAATTPDVTCPPWCTEHLPQDPGAEPLHTARLEVDGWPLRVVEEDGRPAIVTDDYYWMHLPDLRAYAAALVAACDQLEAADTLEGAKGAS